MNEAALHDLQRQTFDYFLKETNPLNGLVIDKTEANWPASIAATGLALAAYPIGVERGFMTRAAAIERTLNTLRFFWNSPHGPEPDATGATKVFIITSSICKQEGVHGNANYQLWIVHFYWQVP